MTSGLLLGMDLSVCTCWFHNTVTLPSWLVSTDSGACSYQCSLSNFTPISLHILKCSWAHTLSCRLMYWSFANIGHVDIMSPQTGDIICICYLFLFPVILLHDILFVTLGLMLSLFHFQFLLSGLPSTARGTYLPH
jgi:hypothetical protein